MSIIHEYLFDIWQRNADPRSAKFPLIDGSPLNIYVHLFGTFLAIKLLFALRITRLPLNPFQLIVNGFLFGIYGVAILFYIWFSKSGKHFVQCTAINRSTNDVVEWFNVYASYILIWVKLIETTAKFLPHICGKTIEFPSPRLVLEAIVDNGFYYSVLKLHPGGICLFSQTLDLFVSLIEFGHRTLASASFELRPQIDPNEAIAKYRRVQHIISFCHGLYFILRPECSVSTGILLCQLLHSGVHLISLNLFKSK